jgi:carbamoyl-phosphate synthase small subunit
LSDSSSSWFIPVLPNSGYQEVLTDPSYYGQIVNFTFPELGNTGINHDDDESDKPHVFGVIAKDVTYYPSNWRSVESLPDYLTRHGIVSIYGIDTRQLTRRIRSMGAMNGIISTEVLDKEVLISKLQSAPSMEGLNLVKKVRTRKIYHWSTSTDKKWEFIEHGNESIEDLLTVIVVDFGIKRNILKRLVSYGCKVIIVPVDTSFDNILSYAPDGIFLSNGPGDPASVSEGINLVKLLITTEIPIFGICMGHQLLALSAGCTAFKMKYGNRGHNQPCIHTDTKRCLITCQNHGFAVSPESMSDEWSVLFSNANDQTNEGIIHNSKPYFSVQFHPEHQGGPRDLELLFKFFADIVQQYKATYLFDNFIDLCKKNKNHSINFNKYDIKKPKKILVLGSGGLSIGQAGEFDYSGSQALRSLKEENIETVLINPNIASIQTAKGLADKVYYMPVTNDSIEEIVKKENPDAITLSFGGQTALNCGVDLFKQGFFDKYNIKVLGTSVESVICTEDRDIFCKKLTEINEPFPQSIATVNLNEALTAADEINASFKFTVAIL